MSGDKKNAGGMAKELLNNHSVTKQLRAFGLTDEQLAGIRFRNTRQDIGFSSWSYHWLEGTPFEAAHLFKAYCALKWVLLENPPHSENKESALAYINATTAAPLVDLGASTKAIQSKRAQNPRGKIPGEDRTINQIIEKLALCSEHAGKRTKELWASFFSKLDELDLEPKEEESLDLKKSAYTYYLGSAQRRITFGRFANVVSTAKKKKSR